MWSVVLDIICALERVCVLPTQEVRFLSASQCELADRLRGFLYNLPVFTLLVLSITDVGVSRSRCDSELGYFSLQFYQFLLIYLKLVWLTWTFRIVMTSFFFFLVVGKYA